jgi:hypothetical protein
MTMGHKASDGNIHYNTYGAWEHDESARNEVMRERRAVLYSIACVKSTFSRSSLQPLFALRHYTTTKLQVQ